MREDKMDDILYEIFNTEIEPSPHIVMSTKEEVKKNRAAQRLLGLSIAANSLAFMALIAYAILVPQHVVVKILIYILISCFTNISLLMIIIFKDKLVPFFSSM